MKTKKTVALSRYEEAAALLATGGELEGLDNDPNNGRVVFLFKDSRGEASALLEKHRMGRLEANTMRFCEALSTAKRLIFDRKDRRV